MEKPWVCVRLEPLGSIGGGGKREKGGNESGNRKTGLNGGKEGKKRRERVPERIDSGSESEPGICYYKTPGNLGVRTQNPREEGERGELGRRHGNLGKKKKLFNSEGIKPVRSGNFDEGR